MLWLFRSTIPAWGWARVGSEEFRSRSAPQLQKVAAEWSPSRGSILLLGPTGVGKTSAAVALAHRLADEAERAALGDAVSAESRAHVELVGRAHWTTAWEIVRAQREQRLGAGESGLIQDAVHASILFLDELGPEPNAQGELLFDIIDRRVTRGRPTIVTSGRTREELVQRYGAALLRRLMATGLGAVVDLHGSTRG